MVVLVAWCLAPDLFVQTVCVWDARLDVNILFWLGAAAAPGVTD